MKDLLELQRKNEEIAAKYQVVEERLALTDNPVALFEGWMTGMTEAFGIPFLWVSIVHDPENGPLIEKLKSSAMFNGRLNLADGAVFMELAPNGERPVLATGEIRPYYRLLPQNKYFIKSLALAPITLHGRVIGSLNHGDSSPTRYAPDMDSSLLQQLASHLSRRLSAMMP